MSHGCDMTIDELKRVDLVALLNGAWGMSFRPEGGSFVALSPFAAESRPSFYAARAADGHWVYCDHSACSSGSIIDLLMRKLGTDDVGRACTEARRLVLAAGLSAEPAPAPAERAVAERNWEWLYRRLQGNDASPCGQYLAGRGIDEALIDGLIAQGTIVLNGMDGSRYCCFAVRDADGALQSLFNRRIDGPAEREKFLLGRQAPFCADWTKLAGARSLYLCEGIIDALSLLTLRPEAVVLGLPGANADLPDLPLPDEARLIEAFDADSAGRAAAERLRTTFPERTIESFDLSGAGDVNECLRKREWMSAEVRGTAKLSIRDRVAIALSDKPSRELAQQYGIHHSRVCDIRNEADTILSTVWASRQPGRNPTPQPPEEVVRKNLELKQLRRDFDLLTMRKEWLDLQLEMRDKRDAVDQPGLIRKTRQKKRRKKSG